MKYRGIKEQTRRAKTRQSHVKGAHIAFYAETIIIVLAFFLVMSVIVQFLGQARINSSVSTEDMTAVMAASDLAEQFQGSSNIDELESAIDGSYTDSNALSCALEGSDEINLTAELSFSEQTAQAGTLVFAHIVIKRLSQDTEIYALDTSKYVHGKANTFLSTQKSGESL